MKVKAEHGGLVHKPRHPEDCQQGEPCRLGSSVRPTPWSLIPRLQNQPWDMHSC